MIGQQKKTWCKSSYLLHSLSQIIKAMENIANSLFNFYQLKERFADGVYE